jgi:tRNA (guanine-N7-)-methyltransferase
LFDAGEVSEIWITFPDPQIKYKRTKHRMTNPIFLERYKRILSSKGCVHLKTDSEYMHGYTLGLLQGLGLPIDYANHDIYKNEGAAPEVLEIQTFYENQYLAQNKPITYLRFRFPA